MLLRSFLGQNKAMSKIELFYSRERKTYIILIGSFEQKLTNPRLIFCLRLKTFNKMPWNAGIRCQIFSSPHVSLILGMKRRKVSLSCNYHVKKEENGGSRKSKLFSSQNSFCTKKTVQKNKKLKIWFCQEESDGNKERFCRTKCYWYKQVPGTFSVKVSLTLAAIELLNTIISILIEHIKKWISWPVKADFQIMFRHKWWF